MSTDSPPNSEDIIICPVTTWYFRRMGLLAAMLVGMGSYFFYDGTWGYAKANKIAEKKEWYEKEVIAGFDAAQKKGDAEKAEWMKMARTNGWIIKPDLQEPRWDDFAAPYGWSSTPKKYSKDEIDQQYWWGGAMYLGAAIAGLLVLLNHNKKFIGHPHHMIMPNGKNVEFAKVFRVDKRKWDNKGLAYVFHREAEGSPERKATIDDLKYGGAGKVLDRLLTQFNGELIEKIRDPDHDHDHDDENAADQGDSQPKASA